jgi:hypothetical protein
VPGPPKLVSFSPGFIIKTGSILLIFLKHFNNIVIILQEEIVIGRTANTTFENVAKLKCFVTTDRSQDFLKKKNE